MAGQGNPFPRNYSIGNSFESSLFFNPIPEENIKRKDCPILEDSVLVGDLEELVETAL